MSFNTMATKIQDFVRTNVSNITKGSTRTTVRRQRNVPDVKKCVLIDEHGEKESDYVSRHNDNESDDLALFTSSPEDSDEYKESSNEEMLTTFPGAAIDLDLNVDLDSDTEELTEEPAESEGFNEELELSPEAAPEGEPEPEPEVNTEVSPEAAIEAEPEATVESKKLNRTAVMGHSSQEVNHLPELNMSTTNDAINTAITKAFTTAVDLINDAATEINDPACTYDDAETKIVECIRNLDGAPIAEPITNLFDGLGNIRNRDLAALRTEIQSINDARDRTLEALRKELDEVKRSRERELETLRKELDGAKTAANHWHDQTVSVANKLAEADNCITNLRLEFNAVKSQLDSAQTKINLYEEQMPMLQGTVTAQAENINRLKEQVAQLQVPVRINPAVPTPAVRSSSFEYQATPAPVSDIDRLKAHDAPAPAVRSSSFEYQVKQTPVSDIDRLKAHDAGSWPQGQHAVNTTSYPSFAPVATQFPTYAPTEHAPVAQAPQYSPQYFGEPVPAFQPAPVARVNPIANINFSKMDPNQIRSVIETHFPGKYTKEMEGKGKISLGTLINNINKNFSA